MRFYKLRSKEYGDQEQYGSKALAFLYNRRLGRFLLERIFARSIYSEWNRKRSRQASSKKKIQELIDQYAIDMRDFEEEDYESFASFFIRKHRTGARAIAPAPALIAPADSYLLAYPISNQNQFKIKGLHYTIRELLLDDRLADEFQDGLALVFRLSMADGHRYCHISDGRKIKSKSIDGMLHTVSHFSDKIKVLAENKREYQVLETVDFGLVVYMEVGAMQVGSIHNHNQETFERSEEKGYFSLGGSTIVLLLQKNRAKLVDEIWEHSREGVECQVLLGEKIGESC